MRAHPRTVVALLALAATLTPGQAANAGANCTTYACATAALHPVNLGCDYYYPAGSTPYADCWFGFYAEYSGSSTLPVGSASAYVWGSASGSSGCGWTLGGCAQAFSTGSAFVRIYACDSATVYATLDVSVTATGGGTSAGDYQTLAFAPWAC